MIIFFKVFLLISVAHACWIGWLAVHRPDSYASLAKALWEKNVQSRFLLARMIWAWLTVLAISIQAVRFSLTFLPYEWGNWEDGSFTPLSDSLATLPSFLIAYLVGLAVDIAGMRNDTTARKTNEILHDKASVEAELISEKERRKAENERLSAELKKATESAENAARTQRESYYQLSQTLAAMQRELVRLKGRVSPDVLSEHEANEKVIKEREAAAPKSRTYYS